MKLEIELHSEWDYSYVTLNIDNKNEIRNNNT